MAETPKKTKSTATKAATAAKPRNTAAKKGIEDATTGPATDNGQAGGGKHVSHHEVAQLAHTYWQQRGHQHGEHEEDWYRAEQELRKKS